MDATVAAGWIGALAGLGGAVVGSLASIRGVVWQQRQAASEAERTYLLGLAEGAANEIIRLSFEIEEHFQRLETTTPRPEDWRAEMRQMLRIVDEQSLRFADKKVRHFMTLCSWELSSRPTAPASFNRGDISPCAQISAL